MRLLVLVPLLLSAGCQTDAPPGEEPPAAAASVALPDTAMVQTVTASGTAALVQDLRRASPSIAIQTIDRWTARLDTTALDGALADTLAAVRDDLGTLRSLLQSSPLDGRAIGETMQDLGRRTGALASGDPTLEPLGRALSVAGGRLVPKPPPADSTDGAVSNNEE